MKYGDDQCEECGAVRVAGSKLCPQCLVRRLAMEMEESLIRKRVIETLRKKNKLLKEMLDETLKYGFRRNQENVRLLRHIKGLEKKVREVMDDEKDRTGENTEE